MDVGFTMSHFYFTLPSDSSANYHPDNMIARFVTKLLERIRLEGEYEMGLAEIVYPHTWYNVDNEDEKYWVVAIGVGRNRM
jgi:phenylalanyl-tRNA synthetase alpha subunit